MTNFTYPTALFQTFTFKLTKRSRLFSICDSPKPLLCLLGFLCLINLASAQTTPPINWQKTFGGSGNDIANALKPTSDGGYMVVGSTESNDGDVSGNHGSTDFWIVKLDGAGNKIWQQTLGGSGSDVAKAVITTSDGGCVVAGYTNSPNGDVTGFHGGSTTYYVNEGGENHEYSRYNYDCWVVKLDRSGNIVWQKTLGGIGDDQASAITASSGGGFIIAGSAGNSSGDVTGNHGGIDFWIVKLNGSGNLVWQKSLGGSNTDYANAITATSDGGCAVAGNTVSNDKDVTGFHQDPSSSWYWADYWIVKLDGAGNLVWQKTLGGTNYDIARSITASSDGGFVVAGVASSIDGDVTDIHGWTDFWIIKLTGTGSIVWQRTIGGPSSDDAYAVTATADGGFLVAGETNITDLTNYPDRLDDRVVKLDGSGNVIWQKALGGTKEDHAFAVLATADGGLMLAGSTASNDRDVTGNHGSNDFWVVKLGAVAPLISGLATSPDPVCVGKPVILTASISNITGTYSYTITNGASVNIRDTSSTPAFSRTLTIGESGLQSLTLTVGNTAGSNLAIRRITVVNDGNCSTAAPCISSQSGEWSNPATWLCGHEPTVNDIVTISPGHVVTISTNAAQVQKLIYQGGTLRYASPGTKLFVKGE